MTEREVVSILHPQAALGLKLESHNEDNKKKILIYNPEYYLFKYKFDLQFKFENYQSEYLDAAWKGLAKGYLTGVYLQRLGGADGSIDFWESLEEKLVFALNEKYGTGNVISDGEGKHGMELKVWWSFPATLIKYERTLLPSGFYAINLMYLANEITKEKDKL